MISNICHDYLSGICASIRIDKFIYCIYTDAKLLKIIMCLIKLNTIFNIIPFVIITFFDLESYWIFYLYENYIAYFLTSMIQIFNFLELAKHNNNHNKKYITGNVATPSFIDNITITALLSFYQTVIYITAFIIKLLFVRQYIIWYVLNFLILSLYHSFYCYNVLWHQMSASMIHRIDMMEKLWPYYIGYATIATLISMNMSNIFIFSLFNLYMAILITIPFLIQPVYPKTQEYFTINLSIFALLTNLFVWTIKSTVIFFSSLHHKKDN